MADFMADVEEKRRNLEQTASKVVQMAQDAGADQCEAVITQGEGLEVSTRQRKVEEILFNRGSSLDIVVYKDHRRGGASTTDFSEQALKDCVQAALSIASYSDPDPYAGICDEDLLCTEEKDLKLLHELKSDPDLGISLDKECEEKALDLHHPLIKDSDGASYESDLGIKVIANSHGFCKSKAGTSHCLSLTLIGEQDGRMQRGFGYSLSRSFNGLKSTESIVQEAVDRTLGKLGAKQVPTGKSKVIFSRNAALSLWGHLLGAISGGAVYRNMTFLKDKLGSAVFPDFISIKEDPFIEGGWGSKNFDGEGLAVHEGMIVERGILNMYLLSTYTGRKLGLKSNAHAGGTANLEILAEGHERSFDELLREAGEGLVITDVMGQGVDLVSGNYSRGANGYYFKNGQKVHAVEEITIASNLKDIFSGIALLGTDYDDRHKIKTGSILVENLSVSGC